MNRFNTLRGRFAFSTAGLILVILVLFGRGRISEMMGDFGKGIRSFKDGMNEEEKPRPSARIEGPSQDTKPAGEALPDDQARTPSDSK